MTAFVGAVAVLAQSVVAIARTSLNDLNHTYQIIALCLISAFVTVFAHLRERHEQEMTQLRSVAETAQHVLMQPLPRRSGPCASPRSTWPPRRRRSWAVIFTRSPAPPTAPE